MVRTIYITDASFIGRKKCVGKLVIEIDGCVSSEGDLTQEEKRAIKKTMNTATIRKGSAFIEVDKYINTLHLRLDISIKCAENFLKEGNNERQDVNLAETTNLTSMLQQHPQEILQEENKINDPVVHDDDHYSYTIFISIRDSAFSMKSHPQGSDEQEKKEKEEEGCCCKIF